MTDFLYPRQERKLAGRADREASPFPADSRSLVGEIARTFDPLRPDSEIEFQVSEVREGFVCLSIVLPVGLTRTFVGLLDSLHGLVRLIDTKTRHSMAAFKASDLAEVAKREEARNAFAQRVCEVFDQFTASGMERKKAISATNKALKAEKHPWATYHLVREVLSSAGRLRQRSSSKQKSATAGNRKMKV